MIFLRKPPFSTGIFQPCLIEGSLHAMAAAAQAAQAQAVGPIIDAGIFRTWRGNSSIEWGTNGIQMGKELGRNWEGMGWNGLESLEN